MTERELIDLVDEFTDKLGSGYKTAYVPRNVVLIEICGKWYDGFLFDLEKKCVFFTLMANDYSTEMLRHFMKEKGLYDFWKKDSEWSIAMHPNIHF